MKMLSMSAYSIKDIKGKVLPIVMLVTVLLIIGLVVGLPFLCSEIYPKLSFCLGKLLDFSISLLTNLLVVEFSLCVIDRLVEREKSKKVLPLQIAIYRKLSALLTNVDIIFFELDYNAQINGKYIDEGIDTFFSGEHLEIIGDAFKKNALKLVNNTFTKDEIIEQKQFENVVKFISGRWKTIEEVGYGLLRLCDKDDAALVNECDYLLEHSQLKWFVYHLGNQGSELLAYGCYFDSHSFNASIKNIVALHKIAYRMYDELRKFVIEDKETITPPAFYVSDVAE